VTALASGSGEIARDPRRGLTEPLGSERTWAIESAGGLGKLLAQQLLEAGGQVVDVPTTLAARLRLLGSTKASKNDSNDALATALAGLRHCRLRAVRVEDHTAVLRMLIDRYDPWPRRRPTYQSWQPGHESSRCKDVVHP
jgi:transposase